MDLDLLKKDPVWTSVQEILNPLAPKAPGAVINLDYKIF